MDNKTFIPPALIEPHFSTRIYKGYLLYLTKTLGEEKAKILVNKLGVPWDYLIKESNWVSETYADLFYDALIECQELPKDFSYQAGKFSMSEEAQGAVHIMAMQLMDPMSIYEKIVYFTKNFNRVDSIQYKRTSQRSVELQYTSRRSTRHWHLILDNWRGFLENVPVMIGLPVADFQALNTSERSACFKVTTSTHSSVIWTRRGALFLGALGIALLYFWTQDFSDSNRLLAVCLDTIALLGCWVWIEKLRDHIHGSAQTKLKTLLKETEDRYDELFESRSQLDRRYREANLLASVIQRISTGQEASTLISTTISEIKSSLEFDRVIYMGFDPNRNVLSTTACAGFESQNQKLVSSYEIDLSKSTDSGFHLGNVFKAKKSILVPVTSDYFESLSEDGKMMLYITKSRSFLACSVATERTSFGVLLVDYADERVVNADDLHIIQNVSNQLAICLDNAGALQLERRLRMAFQRYVPSPVISSVLGESSAHVADGQHQNVSVLFSDIRRFTELSNKLPPKELIEILNLYFRVMTDIVYSFGGIVDKFLGDGLLAIFNPFGKDQEHSLNAVKAAYAMQKAMQIVQERIKTELRYTDVPPLEIGIAVHSGTAILGNIGTDNKTEFTAIGETLNITARLCELSKKVPSSIIVSEPVGNIIRSHFDLNDLGKHRIRGIEGELQVYQVTAERLVPFSIRENSIDEIPNVVSINASRERKKSRRKVG